MLLNATRTTVQGATEKKREGLSLAARQTGVKVQSLFLSNCKSGYHLKVQSVSEENTWAARKRTEEYIHRLISH